MYVCAFNHAHALFSTENWDQSPFPRKRKNFTVFLMLLCVLLCCHHFLVNHGGELNESLKAMLISL